MHVSFLFTSEAGEAQNGSASFQALMLAAVLGLLLLLFSKHKRETFAGYEPIFVIAANSRWGVRCCWHLNWFVLS